MRQKRFKSLVSLQPASLWLSGAKKAKSFMGYKDFIRQALNFMHLDLTQNLAYDRMTKDIMKRTIKSDSNCVDVGCHKGEILDVILKLAPRGTHYGFEPIPEFYDCLTTKYAQRAHILPFALSERSGTSSFHFVKNAPAYSGLQKREYKVDAPEIEEIEVELRPLDEVIPIDTRIDFVKIDVEGGEFAVFKGGEHLLAKYRPVVIFECGMGASEYYGTLPEELFEFVTEKIGLRISLLKNYLKGGSPLSRAEFERHFNENLEYYFIAHP